MLSKMLFRIRGQSGGGGCRESTSGSIIEGWEAERWGMTRRCCGGESSKLSDSAFKVAFPQLPFQPKGAPSRVRGSDRWGGKRCSVLELL
jgi:hypothetical protein